MRDPARIHTILAQIEQIWKQSPDLRLMQLLINAIHPSAPHPELYYTEDTVLLRELGRFQGDSFSTDPE